MTGNARILKRWSSPWWRTARCAVHGPSFRAGQADALTRTADCAPVRGARRRSATTATLGARAFTLIELILVMVLLAVIMAISTPTLSRFFKTRNLDSEAQRFMALAHHAQSRAVAEGVPMILWLSPKEKTYGLYADKTFVDQDPQEEKFTLDDTLTMDVRISADARTAAQDSQFKSDKQDTSGRYTLRFNPDGFASLGSPEAVVFRQGENTELWVAQSRSRLTYDIQTSPPVLARR